MSMEAILATFDLTKDQVTSSEKLFLLSCAKRAAEDFECWPSLQRLTKDTGMDRKTIIKTRQSVMAKGLMVYSGEFEGQSGQIPVMRLTYVNNKTTGPNNGTSTNFGTGTSTNFGTGTSTNFGTQNNKEEKNKGNITIVRPEGERELNVKKSSKKITIENYHDHPLHALFRKFYEQYPKQKQKNPFAAFKAFAKLKPTEEFVDKLIKDVGNRRARDQQWQDAQFIPLPATYLNGAQWEGEIFAKMPQKTFPTPQERVKNELSIKAREVVAENNKRENLGHLRDFQDIVEKRMTEEQRENGLQSIQKIKDILRKTG